MNKPLSLLVALIIIGVLFFSAYIIKDQNDKKALIIDNTAESSETALDTEPISPSKTDTVPSLAAVDATQTDTEEANNKPTSEQMDTTFAADNSKTEKATETAKPSTAKLGNVVALTPKQLAEQKLARQTATAQTNTSATNTTKPANIKTTPTNTPKPETIKTPTISNNKSTNKQMVAATTTVQYSVTIGCFTDTKHQAQLKNLFKLKATENIRTAKHQTNNCWRYMTGYYVNSADAFKKLAELRKYDKDCQVVRISTKNNKETIEIYKGR